MNKLFNILKKIFLFFYKIIDTLIVTPISKLIYIINAKLKNNSGGFEKMFNNRQVLIYASLIFAVSIFFLVDNKVISLVQTEAEIFPNQRLNVQYNKEAYVVEGLPQSVDITLIGRKNDIYLARQLADFEAYLDLSSYSEGTYRVRLTFNQTVGSLRYKLDPSVITVNIKKRISDLKAVSYDLLNQNRLDSKISVKNVELSRSEVVVKGAADTLDRIAIVKALIDLDNPDFKEEGKFTVENIPLVAYDSAGRIVENVDIVAGNMTATIELTSYSIEVPIRVITTGELRTGRAISSILINGRETHRVEIFGDEEILKNITSIPVTIDVANMGNQSRTYNVTIPRPAGVRHMSDTTATITVDFGEETQRTIDNIMIEIRNLSPSFVAQAPRGTVTTVSVQVKGVASIIDALDPKTIRAFIDLSNHSAGTYEVRVEVEGDDPRLTYLANRNMAIEISNR